MEARIAEKLWFEPLAQDFVHLNRQFLKFPMEVRMLGASEIMDPWTLQPVPTESDSIGVNDMLPDYEARAVGATRSISGGALFERMMMLMQVAQTNPIAIQTVNWFTFFRQLFYVAEVPNPDELLGTDSLVQQVMVQAAQGMLQQAAGQALGGAMPGPTQGSNVVPMKGGTGGAMGMGAAPTPQTSVNR